MNSKNDQPEGLPSREVETFGADYHKLESTFSLQPTPPKRPGAGWKKQERVKESGSLLARQSTKPSVF